MNGTDATTEPMLSRDTYGNLVVTGELATLVCTLGHQVINKCGQSLELISVSKEDDGELDPEVIHSPTFGRPWRAHRAGLVAAVKALDEAIGGLIPADGSLSVFYGTHHAVTIYTD